LGDAQRRSAEAMLGKWAHPDLHFTFPTIKLPSMGSDHQPVSDDFIKQWRELLATGPYFSTEQWMEAMDAENQQAIITAGESDELVRKLSLKSSQGGYKVSVVWLPERMNLQAANKLLKLIEEPPQHTVFLMACEDAGQLLATIRSRVQRIDVPRIADDDMMEALQQRLGQTEEEARRIVRLACGNWLSAISETQQGGEREQFLNLYMQLMRQAYQRQVVELRTWSETVAKMGRERQKRFLEYLMRMTRECFAYNFRQPGLVYMSAQEEQFATKFSRFVNERNVLQMYDVANLALRDVCQNANAKIVFFDLAMQMIIYLRQ
jgi:DNA polymerase-3 subunit delta'